jgi:hypothetical protein
MGVWHQDRLGGDWCEMAVSLGVSQLEQRVSCETVAGQKEHDHGSWRSYGVGNRYQVTTADDTADKQHLQGNGPIRHVETCPDFFFSLQEYT